MMMSTNKSKQYIPKSLRFQVWSTYIGDSIARTKCFCCNNIDIIQLHFECGHVIAESRGGPTTVDNLRPICSICNKSMGNKNMIEYVQTYFPESYQLHFTNEQRFVEETNLTNESVESSTLPTEPLHNKNYNVCPR